MEEVAGTAKLVDPAAVDANSALTATLPRSDIEAALQDNEGADLFLEIARIQNGERDDRKIKVAWTHDDLEKLLKQASGDHVSLTFSDDELQRMLDDPDFEAHGFREKALILTVALATAGAGAGFAQGAVLSDGGTTPAPSAAVSGLLTDASTSGIAGSVTSIGTDAATSGGADPAAAAPGSISGPVTDGATRGTAASLQLSGSRDGQGEPRRGARLRGRRLLRIHPEICLPLRPRKRVSCCGGGESDGDRDREAVERGCVRKRLPQPRDGLGAAALVRVWQQHRHFVPAHARDDVVLAERAAD